MNQKRVVFIVVILIIVLAGFLALFLKFKKVSQDAIKSQPVQQEKQLAADNSSKPQSDLCKDESDPDIDPVITSLSVSSGPVGTKLEINGCNLSGFEGDKNVWIENKLGKRGILYGEEGSTNKLIKVTLKSPLCQSDNSYSGFPCKSWLKLTPGNYKIYALPWAKESNKVDFIINQSR